MKRVFSILFALALVLAFTLVATTPVAAATTYYVATTGDNANAGTSWATAWLTIQYAVATAAGGDTIMVGPGTFVEAGQIVINKHLSIIGADKTTTIIKTDRNTAGAGDGRGWFLVNLGYIFNLSKVTLDGSGYLVWQGIRHKGMGTINDCIFKNIKYNESGPDYAGTAIVFTGCPVMWPYDVTNCEFSQIGRVGVLFYSAWVHGGKFSGNVYTGKGVGNWLDYGVEVGAGAIATIQDNYISNCRGVASSDGSTSAGALVTTYYGAGTKATINGNILSDNTEGIAVGYDASDTSTVIANYNNINANTAYGISSTAPTVDARWNWWGANDGPGPLGSGSGDHVSNYVNFSPWSGMEATSTGTGVSFWTVDVGNITMLTHTVPACPNPPVTFPDGMFAFTIKVTPGQTVHVHVSLPTSYPAGTKWWKCQGGSWSSLDIDPTSSGGLIDVTFTDGGRGDADGIANGEIVDDGGPGLGGTVGWETYPISKVRVLLPWIALLAAIALGASLLVLRRRRAQS
jgi:hypothetical protein